MRPLTSSYAYFCDANDLKRIDATPEEHLANLDRMAASVLEDRARVLAEIANRCPSCRGTGRK